MKTICAIAFVACFFTHEAAAGDPDRELAARVNGVFRTHCHRCHGQNGAIEGGINYILDLGKLVSRGKVVPGQFAASPLLTRLTNPRDPMPPLSESVRPTAREIAAVKEWIAAGAPTDRDARDQKDLWNDSQTLEAIDADLAQVPDLDRRFIRYLTLTHLDNAGASEDELQTYRIALAKLVNSLSLNPEITVPARVDPEGLILRVDLRDYRWSEATWDRVLDQYPYAIVPRHPLYRQITRTTRSAMPYVRGDWFVHAASRPPLYHDMLGIPRTEGDLERRIGIDLAADIARRNVNRAGFNGSGIARFNRIIERHESPWGAFWKTYDFANGLDRRNVFARPLGPGIGDSSFRHDAGEMIFNLPNGLFGFMLADGTGKRIDEGPVTIVSIKNRPDPRVINGVSCFSCHARGLIPKTDQVRSLLDDGRRTFTAADAHAIARIYPRDEAFREFLRKDNARYLEALAKTGANAAAATEPIEALSLRFEADLDVEAAAAEVGFAPSDFLAAAGRSPALDRALGPLRVSGGTISRQLWIDVFPTLVRELRLGQVLQRAGAGAEPRRRNVAGQPVAPRVAAAPNVQARATPNSFFFAFGDFANGNVFRVGNTPVPAPRVDARNRRAQPRPATELEPTAIVELDSEIADLALEPEKRSLLVLNRTKSVIQRIDPIDRVLDREELDLPREVHSFAKGRSATGLFVLAGDQVFVVDPATLKSRNRVSPGYVPFGATVDAEGRLLVSNSGLVRTGFFGGMTFSPNGVFQFGLPAPAQAPAAAENSATAAGTIDAIDVRQKRVVGRLSNIPSNAFLAYHPTRPRLYVAASSEASAGKIRGFAFNPTKRFDSPDLGRTVRPGKMIITPDGQYLIHASGIVFRLAEDPTADLKRAGRIASHLDLVLDPATNRIIVSTIEGTLIVYSYPQFEVTKRARLGLAAYRLAFDAESKTLYAATSSRETFDSSTSSGKGDLLIYDIDSLLR